jgi:hypothetical protein
MPIEEVCQPIRGESFILVEPVQHTDSLRMMLVGIHDPITEAVSASALM